ncbi:hypothetical protein DCS_06294 [Drechmeria coniospora]|uniref:Uncharacterized protein n=1 Tax=Drechmeria coniospora TaxID=98403 RepID=A0A151GB55_DRECN|nr:hypothetical protein DCS_06294 [Drechmeria coniospora]KYK54337.1 hypothetical protein DCS_06294 [Drechmeria coniospora]
MPDTEGPVDRTQSQRQRRGGYNVRRRGRGGNALARVDGPDSGTRNVAAQNDVPQLSSQPSSQPESQLSSSRGSQSTANEAGRRPRGRNNRGGRRHRPDDSNPSRRGTPGPATSRAFGGHLTGADVEEPSATSLSADAPAFVPGRPVTSRRHVLLRCPWPVRPPPCSSLLTPMM